ncbi:hypothetical protein MUB16_16130 [Priestia sp. OVL9]|nr:hypothetical protein [Priestia sp. OVL9]
MDLQEAFKECVKLPEQEWIGEVERAEKQVIGLNRNDETVTKFAQFSTYIKKHIQSEELDALAMRCWPDFFNDLGAAPCSTLSQFTEDGMVTSCESDIHGSISMFILRELAGGNAPYLGDLVHIDEEKTQLFFGTAVQEHIHLPILLLEQQRGYILTEKSVLRWILD